MVKPACCAAGSEQGRTEVTDRRPCRAGAAEREALAGAAQAPSRGCNLLRCASLAPQVAPAALQVLSESQT